MRKQQIARRSAVQAQVRSHVEGVSGIEEQHGSVILAYTVLEKIIHSHADDNNLGPRPLPEKPPQRVQPVIVSSRLQKDRIDAYLGGSQRAQAVQFHSMQEQGI